MTEILVQSSLAVSRSKQLASEAAQIVQRCAADHKTKRVIECAGCYAKVVDVVRARYLKPAPGDSRDWFTSRRGFLQELDAMLADTKQYQVDPHDIDRRIQDERSRWYAENVRYSLLRLMVDDPSGREAVFEKLEDPPSDAASLAKEIAEILSKSLPPQPDMADVPDRLAAAKTPAARLEVLKDAFFTLDNVVPADHQKYLDMLGRDQLTLEQVVDRVLEEKQAAAGAREQTERLKRRLDELRRARAAHELQKTRKAKSRASFAEEQSVPDELYKLPPCAVCSDEPSPKNFLCCPICAILTRRDIRAQQPSVYCSPECEEKGHTSHAKAHTCASGSDCIQQLHPQDADVEMQGTDDGTTSSKPPAPKICFCTECLTSLKLPTTWCSLACADKNFQRHREDVHIPARKRLGITVTDRDRLSYDAVDTSLQAETKYHAIDIGAHITTYEAAVRAWEGQNAVKLQS
ncbi:hypothetical protein B0T22DRAFT_478098 [Podospora appendiculata]|uniref:Suppressor of anucleate metulae protein B n=1 Tax=Podospora appendiculata TaxID=314037 RepID=A0AAE0XL71_9PEZI|nr:hypothetical protein B0T22DRAFT_478098 [Podospora appendiculata]